MAEYNTEAKGTTHTTGGTLSEPGFGSPGVGHDSTAWSWADPSPPILSMAQI
jgi:hypothetical protein